MNAQYIDHLAATYETSRQLAATDGRTGTWTYSIECEAGSFTFQHLRMERIGGLEMEVLHRNGRTYWYEPGDSYLYDAPDGGESFSLGEVYNYGVLIDGE